jgi:hypothetical protein
MWPLENRKNGLYLQCDKNCHENEILFMLNFFWLDFYYYLKNYQMNLELYNKILEEKKTGFSLEEIKSILRGKF